MTNTENGCALRIYINEGDKDGTKPLFEALVQRAEEHGIAGATVFRASMGFGPKHHLVAAKVLRLAADLPVVVEVIDTREKIDQFLENNGKLIESGLATIEPVEMIRFTTTA